MSSSTDSHSKCPVTGATGENPHPYIAPSESDYRAPCPAMNTMANHGYLPRDGQAINADMIVDALMACYKLSKPLAWFLTHGALFLLDQGSGDFNLHDLARHNKIEHNASLYHEDAKEREEYAPIHGNPELLKLVFEDSADGVVMTPEDVARVRVRREATSNPPLDFIHAELAKGEMAIVLNMFNNPDPTLHDTKHIPLLHRNAVSRFVRRLVGKKDSAATRQLDGVPIERMRYWFEHERLPEDWTPYHKTTLREVVVTNNRMRSAMKKMRKEQKKTGVPAPVLAATPVETQAEVKVEPTPEAEAEPVEKSHAVSSHSASASESEDTNTLSVPHHLNRSQNSSTSSNFPESALHTPSTSEFYPHPYPVIVDPKQGHGELPRLETFNDKLGLEQMIEVREEGVAVVV